MIDLEERLRRAADLLDEEALLARDAPLVSPPGSMREAGRSASSMCIAAICILVVGLIGTFWATARDRSEPVVGDAPAREDDSVAATVANTAPMTTAPGTVPEASMAIDVPPTTMLAADPAVTFAPPVTEAASIDEPLGSMVAPSETLPQSANAGSVVPPTVVGTGPTEWYRLQPDLDVAWYSDGGRTSYLCFRTPAGQQCQVDDFRPTAIGGGPIGVRSVDDQLLVVTLDPGTTVSVALQSGRSVVATVSRDEQIGWGVARFRLSVGDAPVGMSMLFDVATDPTAPATTAG